MATQSAYVRRSSRKDLFHPLRLPTSTLLCLLQASRCGAVSAGQDQIPRAVWRRGGREKPDCARNARWQLREPKNKAYCLTTRNNRQFTVSSAAPIARNLPRAAASDVAYLTALLARVAARARAKRRNDFLAESCRAPSRGALASRAHFDWLRATRVWTEARHLPAIRSHCLTSVAHAPASAVRTLARLRSLNAHVGRTARALRERARTKARPGVFDAVIRAWPTAIADVVDEYRTSVYRCNIRHLVGVRAHGSWGLHVTFTSEQIHRFLPAWQREYMGETVMLDEDGKMRARPAVGWVEWRRDGRRENGTTFFARWGGRPAVTAFTGIELLDTPALRRVLQSTQKARALVQDTLFGSNIAILVLPLFMTLAPISYLEFVQTPMVFMYGAVTDVFSTLPLFVKGLELLAFENHVGCDTWFHGIEEKDPQSTVIAETWCASCCARNSLRAHGYVFIVVSLCFMVLGVSLEFYSRQRLLSRMKKGEPLPRRFWSWAEKENPEMYGPGYAPAQKVARDICTKCICGEDNLVICGMRQGFEKNAVLTHGWRELYFCWRN